MKGLTSVSTGTDTGGGAGANEKKIQIKEPT